MWVTFHPDSLRTDAVPSIAPVSSKSGEAQASHSELVIPVGTNLVIFLSSTD